MTTQRRWMKWVFEEADAPHVAMPWERRAKPMGWKDSSPIETLRRASIPA